MQRRAVVRRVGPPEVIELEAFEAPEPGPGEVWLRHTAIGVNFIDTYHRSGLYPQPLPTGLGQEVAGVVERLGPGVTEVRVGERVASVAGPPGSYATGRLQRADKLVPLPDGVSDAVAAASLLKGMTVEYLVHRTHAVQPGDTVLWHAAAGGVGLIACQWLAALGVTVIGTVSTDEKAELARAHGCHHPLVVPREDFVARVRALTDGRGVPVVYDSVGRDTLRGSLGCLAPRGLLVAFGNASGKPAPLDLLDLATAGSLYVTRPILAHYTATREELLLSAGRLFAQLAAGSVRVEVRHRWPLAEAAAAHRALEGRATTGSLLLEP